MTKTLTPGAEALRALKGTIQPGEIYALGEDGTPSLLKTATSDVFGAGREAAREQRGLRVAFAGDWPDGNPRMAVMVAAEEGVGGPAYHGEFGDYAEAMGSFTDDGARRIGGNSFTDEQGGVTYVDVIVPAPHLKG